MVSIPAILELFDDAISSFLQQTVAIRQLVISLDSFPVLLNVVEDKTIRIRESMASIEKLVQIVLLDSDFYSRIFMKMEELKRDFSSIEEDLQINPITEAFLASSNLGVRLSDVGENLQNMEECVKSIGLIAKVISKNVLGEYSGINRTMKCMNAAITLLNRVLSGNQPIQAATYLLEIARTNGFDVSTFPIAHRPNYGMLSTEHNSRLYFLLGQSYYTGEADAGKDYYRAARYLIAAYAHGSKQASYYLGKLYYEGLGVQQCFSSAFKYFSYGAVHGDRKALNEVGWCLEFGLGTERDSQEAVKYFNMSAEQGNGDGMRSAGYHALHGNVTRQNWPKAVRLLQQARREGVLLANFDLADCYEHGIGVKRDPHITFKLLQEAYESGEVMSSAFHLARCYEFGIGVKQDLEKAAGLYRELRTQRTWEGKLLQAYYGMCLVRGRGVEKNVRNGLKVIRAGLKNGHGCGWAVYGDCYRKGYGVEKDVLKAVRFYSRAISATSGARGIADAHFALAEMFETGEGLAYDAERAAGHYIQAADRMNRIAQWKAGTFFEDGVGVEPQMYRAFYYFDLSARSGFAPGKRKAGELCMRGNGIPRDRAKAVLLLEEAVRSGDDEAKKVLRRAKLMSFFMPWKR